MKKLEWKKAYKSQRKLCRNIQKSIKLLRCERKYVKVSDIAEHYYCEKKVELEEIHGEKESEDLIFGRECHKDLIAGFEKFSFRKRWKKI